MVSYSTEQQTSSYRSPDIITEGRSLRSEERWAALIGGLLMLRLGLRPRGLVGIIMAAIGIDLLYRGLTGDSLYGSLQLTSMSSHYLDSRYDYHSEMTGDIVDEAGEGSFPASDPPSFTGS